MDISINTPALLFPAISLIMLAHTNRFLAISSVIRNLYERYEKGEKSHILHKQIKSLRYRLKLIKNMQALGVLSFISCIFSMYFIYIEKITPAHYLFAFSLLSFTASLLFSLLEIQKSTKALELQLSGMDDLEDPSIVEYLKQKLKKDEPQK